MAKAYLVENEKCFKPVKIVVELETQEELNLFGTIFCYCPISHQTSFDVKVDWCEPIRRAAKKAGGSTSENQRLNLRHNDN